MRKASCPTPLSREFSGGFYGINEEVFKQEEKGDDEKENSMSVTWCSVLCLTENAHTYFLNGIESSSLVCIFLLNNLTAIQK